jgi:hypothetical protein
MEPAARGIRRPPAWGTLDEEGLDEALEELVEDALALPGPVWSRGSLRALHQDRIVSRRLPGKGRKLPGYRPTG